MNFEDLLTSMPVEEWKVRQVVALDWYDAPRGGLCALSRPEVEFCFELLDERYDPDSLDDRLFRLSELPVGSVDGVLDAVKDVGRPVNSVWVPLWRFPTEAKQLRAEQRIRDIQAAKRPTCLVIFSKDMEEFLGCWRIDPTVKDVQDWFELLALAPLATVEKTD